MLSLTSFNIFAMVWAPTFVNDDNVRFDLHVLLIAGPDGTVYRPTRMKDAIGAVCRSFQGEICVPVITITSSVLISCHYQDTRSRTLKSSFARLCRAFTTKQMKSQRSRHTWRYAKVRRILMMICRFDGGQITPIEIAVLFRSCFVVSS